MNGNQIVVAVSSRALFDLELEHQIFETEGFEAFKDHQAANQDKPLDSGVAFPFVKRILNLNKIFEDENLVRVIVLSRNSPETARRFFNSCKYYGLPINAGAFTSGQSTYPYLSAFNVSLFLSANPTTVSMAIKAGRAGGLVLPNQMNDNAPDDPTLRIAFDFDGVLADDEAEREFQKEGIRAFQKLESEKAQTPHSPGPMRDLFAKLSELQRIDYLRHGKSDPYYKPAIRIAIVTSRGAQSEERLNTTLKSFGMSAAELFLLDGIAKSSVLEVFQPHLFFDDQVRHLEAIESRIPCVLVPFGIHNKFAARPL